MKLSDILTGPDKWTNFEYARDKNGVFCSRYSDLAICFCLIGAISLAYPIEENYLEILRKIRKHIGQHDITKWNDAPERTWDDIAELIRKVEAE